MIDVQNGGEYKAANADAFWQGMMSTAGAINREIVSQQLKEQLAHVDVAQIPDREVLAIWRDTLNEAVERELSAEVGFELLCQRMEAWEKE